MAFQKSEIMADLNNLVNSESEFGTINQCEFRTIDRSDYDKGVIDLLSELTVAEKDKMSRNDFNDYVDYVWYNPFFDTLVLEHNGVIVATGSILVERKLIHNFGAVAHIEDVVVKSGYRGKDLGKKILQALVDLAKECECYKVILDCDEKNIGFYKKCGFERHGVQMRLDL